jgi:hypothetical protein
MVGGMDSGMDSLTDIPIKIRTKEKLTIYVVWEVTVDTDTKIVEVNGAMKHVPEDTDNDTDNDTDRNTIIGRMREMQLMLIGYMQPKDYVLDAVFAPKNSIVIIDGEKHTKCGVVSENHAIISDNYVIENVTEIDCPTYKELAEMAIHLKALNYRLNAFTYKYDLMVITLLKKHGLIQLE